MLDPNKAALFPNLNRYQVTSPATRRYNCIAWVFGDTTRRWWPYEGYYWPLPTPERTETVEDFVGAFATQGFELCADGSLEQGYEKIAIYARDGEPTHAAKQLENGSWTSKLGSLEDIEHTSLDELNGNLYGQVEVFMRRLRKTDG